MKTAVLCYTAADDVRLKFYD